MATNASQVNTNDLTQLLILGLGSRNACMRAIIAHPTDLNAAANWLISHRNDTNINTDPFAAATTTTTTTTATTIPAATATTTNTNTFNLNRYNNTNSTTSRTNRPVHTQQYMITQVMNLGYTREEALRAYTNVPTTDRNDTNKLVQYLVQNPKNKNKDKKSYSTYSSQSSSYYPYSNTNKKKVYRPVINIDDIKIEEEKICDITECDALEHIGIMLREYKKFVLNVYQNKNNDNHVCDNDVAYEKNGFYSYFLDTISGNGDYTLTDVMDDYIHVIQKHDVKYTQFNKISRYLIGSKALNGVISSDVVNIIKRNRISHDYKNDKLFELYFGFKSVKEICIQQLMDKIYSYFINSYDTANRLNVDDYKKLDSKYEQKLDDNSSSSKKSVKEKSIASYVNNIHYMKYVELLNKNRVNWDNVFDDNKRANFNKFYLSFNVNDLEKRIDPKELKKELHLIKNKKRREEARKKKLEQDRLAKIKKEKDAKDAAAAAAAAVVTASTVPVTVAKKDDKVDKNDKDAKDVVTAVQSVKAKDDGISGLDAGVSGVGKIKPKSKAKAHVLPSRGSGDKSENKHEFQYGVRYNYWLKASEDLIAITLTKKQAKHKTFKDELLNNRICKISKFEWNLLNEKAEIYINTEYCSESIEAGVNNFGIDLLAKITKPHLVAVMLYCNYDELRNAFTATYVRTTLDETNESLINRHRNYYHLGKLLREVVECFGIEAHRSQTKVFYHGINMNSRITNDDDIKSLYIFPPFSTTSSMEICLNHINNNNNNNLLIMELRGYVSKYFDCSWISDYSYEQEKIFFGGSRSLSVKKCIDFNYGYDYKLFINSMKYIPSIFKMDISNWKINKSSDDLLNDVKLMIKNLIFHQLNKTNNKKYRDVFGANGIPKDIDINLNELCQSATDIRIHYDAMYNHRAYAFLSSLFMVITRTFANLDVFIELFPQLKSFSIIRVPLTTLLFMYLKSYLKKQQMMKSDDDIKSNVIGVQYKANTITQITLIDPKTDAMSIDAVIVAERTSLAKMQWLIESPDQVSLILRYSIEPILIQENAPQLDDDDGKDDQKDDQKGPPPDDNKTKSKPKPKLKTKPIPQPGATKSAKPAAKSVDAATDNKNDNKKPVDKKDDKK